MSDTPTVHAAVGRVLAALPAIGKNQRNAQQGFNFRGIDDVLNALNPLLSEHGVIIVPHRVVERTAGQRQTKSGSVMYEVGLHVQYRIYGPAGDYIEAEAWGEGTDSGDKATPKAMTGAYKYMLFEAFSISTEEASKTDADRHSPEPAMRLIDCPEACGHQATKDDLRGHLLDRHGWNRHTDGRVTRPKNPTQGRSDDDATTEGDAGCPGSPAMVPPATTGGRGASEPSPASEGGEGRGSPAGAAPRTSRPTPPAPAGAGDVERPAPAPSPHGDASGGPAPAAGAPPSAAQRGMLHSLIAEKGIADRHQWAADVLGREVASYSDLTSADYRVLIDAAVAAPEALRLGVEA